MQDDEFHRMEGDLRTELLRAAHELAAARMDLVMRRWGVDLKYSQTQPRVAAGQDGAGQWTTGPGGLTARVKRARAARKAAKALARMKAANPEAAGMAARTLGLPAAVGAMGISRAAGMASVLAGGGASRIGGTGMTPFGMPFDLPVMIGMPMSARTPEERGRIEDECAEQLRADEITCKLNATLNAGKGGNSKDSIYATCMEQAMARYAQCRYEGSPSDITIPLFTGRKIK